MTDPRKATAADPAAETIEVSSLQGLIDGLQAAGRYATVILTLGVAAAAFIRVRDFAGFVAYVQANGGQFVGAVSGLIGLGVAAYGVFKSRKRGAQLSNVAADDRVPDKVARLK
jgi:hypothetical protein